MSNQEHRWLAWASEMISRLEVVEHSLIVRISALEKKVLTMATQADLDKAAADIKAAFESYKANVDSQMASQAAAIQALQDKLNNLPGVDVTALQADLDEINAANAAVTPVTPAT